MNKMKNTFCFMHLLNEKMLRIIIARVRHNHSCRQGSLPFPGLRIPIDGCLYDVVPSVNSDVGGEYFNICLELRLQQFCSIIVESIKNLK